MSDLDKNGIDHDVTAFVNEHMTAMFKEAKAKNLCRACVLADAAEIAILNASTKMIDGVVTFDPERLATVVRAVTALVLIQGLDEDLDERSVSMEQNKSSLH